MTHQPPVPYFGSKRRAAAMAWEHLGDPACYIEPFGGSLAVLLARPHEPRAEIATDLDGLVLNFWRAVQLCPDAVLRLDGGPVAEAQIEAWHHELIAERLSLTEALRTSPTVCDPVAAHRWWAGASAWVGKGWCNGKVARQRPHVDRTLKGLYALGLTDERLHAIAARLAGVILLAEDWTRAVAPSILDRFRHDRGGVGLFVDPPYSARTGRERGLYAFDAAQSSAVQTWALEASTLGGVSIVVAGYEGEYPELERTWQHRHWNAPNGYAGSGNARRHAEVLLCWPRRRTVPRR